jgi:hypothetical protein
VGNRSPSIISAASTGQEKPKRYYFTLFLLQIDGSVYFRKVSAAMKIALERSSEWRSSGVQNAREMRILTSPLFLSHSQ